MVTLNGTRYNTLGDALRSPQSGTVFLDGDMTEDVTVLGRNRVLDLNGFVLKNVEGPVITVGAGGSLTIKDSKGEGNVISVVKDKPAVLVEYGGKLIIEGGTYTFAAPDDPSGFYVLQTFGTISMLDGTVIGAGNASAVTAGYYDSKFVAPGPAVFNMSGGSIIHDSFIAVKCDSSGVVGISGGTIRALKEAVLSWNDTTIRGGDIISTSMQAILVGNEGFESTQGRVSIAGGNITGVGRDISGVEGQDEGTKVTITGGEFTNPLPPEYIPENTSMIQGPDGKYRTVSDRWIYPEGDRLAWGLARQRTILHRDIVQYTSGGLELPVIPENSVLISVSAKGGVTGYHDTSTGKLHLFKGSKEVSGTLEDVTVVFFHF